MYTLDFKNILDEYSLAIDNALIEYVPDVQDGQQSVVKAMKYSITNGGKRIRPLLALEFCKMCGGDVKKAMPLACAVEFIHTYSLIHDDLPCMDDDDVRRGNPACHKMYGEATALLAGDALLTHAFELICSSDISPEQKINAVNLLAQNAGVNGMIGGQVLDLKYEETDPTISDLLTVHKLKTGALISAACLMGCISADADEQKMIAASKFAYYLGIAFQIKDDILDVSGDENIIGKPVGSDAENNKTTYVSLVGISKAQENVEKLTNSAVEQLKNFENTEFVEFLANYLVNRDK